MIMRVLKATCVIAALAAGGVLLVLPGPLQAFEARTTAELLRLFLGYRAQGSPAGTPAVQFGPNSLSDAVRVSAECSSAPVLALLSISTAALLAGRADQVDRLLLATVTAGGFFFVVNLVRLVGVCWALARFGDQGFRVAHVYLGSVVSLAGLVGAAAVYLATAGMWSARLRGPGPQRASVPAR